MLAGHVGLHWPGCQRPAGVSRSLALGRRAGALAATAHPATQRREHPLPELRHRPEHRGRSGGRGGPQHRGGRPLVDLAGLVIPFGSVIGPLAVWLTRRHRDPFIDQTGREARHIPRPGPLLTFRPAVPRRRRDPPDLTRSAGRIPTYQRANVTRPPSFALELAGRRAVWDAAAMPSLRVGTWNIAGARREQTNQVDLDAVVAGVRALGSTCWPCRRSTGCWPAAAAPTSQR
jgi:Domain of unknown function (DUF4870)